MIYDIQKASILKRFSAALLDFFLIVILAVGVMWLMAWATGISKYSDTFQTYRKQYEEEYKVDFDVFADDYEKLSEEKQTMGTAEEYKENYEKAYKALFAVPEVVKASKMLYALPLLIITIGILIPALVFEFVIPLCLKNGRTVGKRVFNLGVVFKNSVKISNFALFVRAVLGKYTIEMMVPAMLLLMVFYYNVMGIVGLVVLGLLFVMQIVILIATKTNALIHDVLANTVVVDMQTQMVFDSYDELTQYKEELHAEEVKKADY